MATKCKSVKDSPGQVSFGVNFKPSRAFNTLGFSFGQSLTILPSEAPQDAQDRVIAEVTKAVERHLDKLSKKAVDLLLKTHENMAPMERMSR